MDVLMGNILCYTGNAVWAVYRGYQTQTCAYGDGTTQNRKHSQVNEVSKKSTHVADVPLGSQHSLTVLCICKFT